MIPIITETDITHPTTQASSEEYKSELIYQKNLLFFILDYLPVGIFVKDCKDNFKYVIWNKKMEEYYGIPWREAIGKSDADVHANTTLSEMFYAEDLKLVNDSHITSQKYTFTATVNGRDTTFCKQKVIFKDRTGQPDLIVGVLQDVTNEKQAENVNSALIASIAGDVVDRNRNYIMKQTGKLVPPQTQK